MSFLVLAIKVNLNWVHLIRGVGRFKLTAIPVFDVLAVMEKPKPPIGFPSKKLKPASQ